MKKPVTRMANAWQKASVDLGFEFITPFHIEGPDGILHTVGLIPYIGSPRGTIIFTLEDMLSLNDERMEMDEFLKGLGYYGSWLNPLYYKKYSRRVFLEALKDWGWYGSPENAPSWILKDENMLTELCGKASGHSTTGRKRMNKASKAWISLAVGFVVTMAGFIAYQGYLPASDASIVRRAQIDVQDAAEHYGEWGLNPPADPYSGEDLKSNAKLGIVWSIGPDRVNQQGIIRYDPTNGAASGGDIVASFQK